MSESESWAKQIAPEYEKVDGVTVDVDDNQLHLTVDPVESTLGVEPQEWLRDGVEVKEIQFKDDGSVEIAIGLLDDSEYMYPKTVEWVDADDRGRAYLGSRFKNKKVHVAILGDDYPKLNMAETIEERRKKIQEVKDNE